MLGCTRAPPVAPDFEQIMGQTHETPFATDFGQPAQQEAAEPTRFFNLAKHWLHDDFASGVHRTPFRGAHLRCHALLGRGGCLSHLRLQDMVSLTARRHVWLKSQLLYSCGCRLAIITTVIRG